MNNYSKYMHIFIFYYLQIKLILTFKKNVIIGAIANYEWDSLKLFFKSYENANFENCDMIMFVDNINQATRNEIKSYGATIYELPEEYKNWRINNYRYKIYTNFLFNKLDIYNMVLLTDVRDVVFQSDLFKFYNNSKKFLGLAIEDGIISEPLNKKWMINTYGETLFKTIEEKPIICSGTIWGSIEIIYNFCKVIWEKINSSNITIPLKSRHDQTIANYIIYYLKMFGDYIIESHNDDGPIMTIGLTLRKDIYLDSKNNIINKKGKIAAVIHQYDRKIDIVKIQFKKYHLKFKDPKERYKYYIIFIFIIVIIICFMIYCVILAFVHYKDKKSNTIKKMGIISLKIQNSHPERVKNQ